MADTTGVRKDIRDIPDGVTRMAVRKLADLLDQLLQQDRPEPELCTCPEACELHNQHRPEPEDTCEWRRSPKTLPNYWDTQCDCSSEYTLEEVQALGSCPHCYRPIKVVDRPEPELDTLVEEMAKMGVEPEQAEPSGEAPLPCMDPLPPNMSVPCGECAHCRANAEIARLWAEVEQLEGEGCPKCGGSGGIDGVPCDVCHGDGDATREQLVHYVCLLQREVRQLIEHQERRNTRIAHLQAKHKTQYRDLLAERQKREQAEAAREQARAEGHRRGWKQGIMQAKASFKLTAMDRRKQEEGFDGLVYPGPPAQDSKSYGDGTKLCPRCHKVEAACECKPIDNGGVEDPETIVSQQLDAEASPAGPASLREEVVRIFGSHSLGLTIEDYRPKVLEAIERREAQDAAYREAVDELLRQGSLMADILDTERRFAEAKVLSRAITAVHEAGEEPTDAT